MGLMAAQVWVPQEGTRMGRVRRAHMIRRGPEVKESLIPCVFFSLSETVQLEELSTMEVLSLEAPKEQVRAC